MQFPVIEANINVAITEIISVRVSGFQPPYNLHTLLFRFAGYRIGLQVSRCVVRKQDKKLSGQGIATDFSMITRVVLGVS